MTDIDTIKSTDISPEMLQKSGVLLPGGMFLLNMKNRNIVKKKSLLDKSKDFYSKYKKQILYGIGAIFTIIAIYTIYRMINRDSKNANLLSTMGFTSSNDKWIYDYDKDMVVAPSTISDIMSDDELLNTMYCCDIDDWSDYS